VESDPASQRTAASRAMHAGTRARHTALARGVVAHGRDMVLSLLLLFGLLLVTHVYVAHERIFYYWDFTGYHGLASTLVERYAVSPLAALTEVYRSLFNEYNLVFAVPLLPFLLGFGPSRQVYEAALVVCFAFPFLLVLGQIGAQLFPSHARAARWAAIGAACCTPAVWVPTLRGYPDVGAALCIALAMWAYLVDPTLRRRWQSPAIGVALALAPILRRHFAYAALAVLIAVAVSLLADWAKRRWGGSDAPLRDLLLSGCRLALTGACCLLALLVLDPPFLVLVLTVDYLSLYASYMHPPGVIAGWLVETYGVATLALAALGYGLAWRHRLAPRPTILFVAAHGLAATLLWSIVVRQIGPHYALHLAPTVALGLAALALSTWRSARAHWWRWALACCAALQLVVGLAPVSVPAAARLQPLLARSEPPLVHADLPGIVALTMALHDAVGDGTLYVAASSHTLNSELIDSAAVAIYGPRDRRMQVLRVPEVDSRDGLPLGRLLAADAVLVVTPYQYHLGEDRQRVVRAANDLFLTGQPFARDFERVAGPFVIGDPADSSAPRAVLYRRLRPTSPEIAAETRAYLEDTAGAAVRR
jgi:hypothetical protein